MWMRLIYQVLRVWATIRGGFNLLFSYPCNDDETHVSEQCGLTDLNYWRDNSIMYSKCYGLMVNKMIALISIHVLCMRVISF
jgi:hypothetical protein